MLRSSTGLVVGIALLGLTPRVGCAEEPTFAERLGWPAGARVVIFHCDDAGMSHSSNLGAIAALEGGLLTSVSTMMPCSWVPEFAAYLKAHPEVDNGIHATLTCEWKNYRWGPLVGRGAAPGLVDEQGCLWHGVEDVAAHASPDEVEREIRAQVERAEGLGIPITHLDTHMGTVFASEEFLAAYIKVGVEKKIPIMLPGGHMFHALQNDRAAVERLQGSGIVEQVWAAGLPIIDDVFTESYGWKTLEAKKANLINFLRTLRPGITLFIVHCTKPTEEFPFISDSGPTRLADLDVMLDPEIKALVQEEHIITTTWRELKQRRDAVGTPAAPVPAGK